MIVTLYDDSPLGHDKRAQKGDGNFEKSLDAIRQGAQARIPVTLSSFHRLPELARFAAAIRGEQMQKLPLFSPADEPKLLEGFENHWRQLHPALGAGNLSFGEIDPTLRKVLSDFDARANAETRPNLLRLLGVLSDAVFIGPHTFHMDIANACNTNCTFCGLHSPLLIEPKTSMPGRRFTEGWKTGLRDWDEFTALVDDLHEIGCREDILFNGEGEPLTHPRASDMIRYICDKNMKLTLFSNGLAITPDKAKLFVENDINILYWSLHAANEKTFHRMQPARRPEDFGRMVENMRELVRRKRTKNNKPYIIAAMVINIDNYGDCEKFMDLCVDIGVDSVRYQIMHACSSTESLLIDKEQFEVVKKGLDRARLKAEKHGLEVVANIDFQLRQSEKTYESPDVLSCEWSHDLYSRTGCLAGWFFARSFCDGLTSFCCHDKILGSLKRTGFKELWFGDAYRRVRQAAKAFDPAHNIDLSEAGCGGLLLGADCSCCGNYEFINKAFDDLNQLGWRKFMTRIPPG
jgi:MoaA/NifB/PqqE/SkfB family radical SAM enzyme